MVYYFFMGAVRTKHGVIIHKEEKKWLKIKAVQIFPRFLYK